MTTERAPSGAVASAIHDARVQRDERGLMPLEEARSWLAARDSYRRGEGEHVDGTFVLESDRTWAALLSLADAAELVEQATRLSWEFHVRGRDNLAAFERYGDGILPWLASRIHGGVLYNIPWCVLPCLLAIGTREALEVALRVEAVHELLPGQPPLGGGPGAFAHDDVERGNQAVPEVTPEEARTLTGSTASLDVARSWIGRHPERYGDLASMADAGNARAEALLRDRAEALGDGVRDAIEDAIGAQEAGRIAARFALPTSVLPAEVKAILEAAETVDEPRGPLWGIAELDDASRSYDLPIWDNANYTTARMRVTGFASRHGDTLIVERLQTSPLWSELVGWAAVAYGPGPKARREATATLVDTQGEELQAIRLDDSDDYIDPVSLVTCVWAERDASGAAIEGSSGWRRIPVPLPMDEQIFTLQRALSKKGEKGVEAHVGWHLPRSFAELPADAQAELRAVTPDEGMLVQLAARYADRMFARDEDLAATFGFDTGAKRIFQVESFAWPAAGELASSSLDLVTLVAALRARKRIDRLPQAPNATPEHWLPRCASLRSYSGDDAWPPGESPIEVERPTDGPGASPYWSWLIEARGYPHGAMILHGSAWNKKGMAEQTVAYLIGSRVPAMQVFWPRRAAILWARVVGSVESAWAAADLGVARAMKDDRMLYAAEAAELVRRFAARELGAPRHVGADFVDALEALVGGRAVVAAFASAIGALGDAVYGGDRPALAGAVFELGFVLGRIDDDRDAARAELAALANGTPAGLRRDANDVARALDLVLDGRAAAERSARCELDYAHVPVAEIAFARGRILDAATEASRASALLLARGGDALIDKILARGDADPDLPFAVTQLAKLGGRRAVEGLLELHGRAPLRDAVARSFKEGRPRARDELVAATEGPFADAARAVLALLPG